MPEDESPVRKKLRKALVKKLLGREANTDPTIQAAASSEVKQLLALPRLTEQDLNAAERRINQLKAQFQMYPEPNMPPGGGGGWVGGDNAAHRQSLHQQLVGWRAPKVPLAKVAPERGPGERHSNWESISHHGGERRGVAHEQKAGTLSTSRARRKAVSMDQASHHAVPRLTDRELRAIPTLELVELIQALAAPEFLANHKLVGPAKMLAAKFNKENITSIYNLLFDLGLFRHGGGRGQARRASRVAAVPPSSKQKEPGMLEKKNIHMSYDDEQPPWQVKHKNSTPLETARMPRMGSFLNPKIANALPPVNGAGFNAQEYAQKSPYLANAPFGAAGYAGEADEPFQRSHWDARRVPAVSQEDWSYYEEKGGRDFVKENQNAAVRAPLRPDAARLILKEDQAKPPHAPGEIPEYLQKRKQELARREVQKKLLEQPGLQPIPDEQRLEVLANLQQRYKEVSNELGMLSFRGIADSHVRPMVSNKAKALETQLRELETAIRHFSRQKVYISS